MYILHTVLYTFLMVLTRRICLTIKSFFSWWSFPVFLLPYSLIQGRCCEENFITFHSKGLRVKLFGLKLGRSPKGKRIVKIYSCKFTVVNLPFQLLLDLISFLLFSRLLNTMKIFCNRQQELKHWKVSNRHFIIICKYICNNVLILNVRRVL